MPLTPGSTLMLRATSKSFVSTFNSILPIPPYEMIAIPAETLST